MCTFNKKIHDPLSPLDCQNIGHWHDTPQTEDGSNISGEQIKGESTADVSIWESR